MMSVVDGAMLAASNSLGVLIVVKATLILTLALIGVRVARRTRPSIRHAILAAAFGALMALPIISIVAKPQTAPAQPASERPSFEVASVKAILVDDPDLDFVPRRSGNRITIHAPLG